jgi:CheY-like chemotaxis protein
MSKARLPLYPSPSAPRSASAIECANGVSAHYRRSREEAINFAAHRNHPTYREHIFECKYLGSVKARLLTCRDRSMSVPQQPPFSATPSELSGRRVLVVDDEFEIASYLAELLREFGAEIVGPATTLQEALLLARTKEPHCAILDIHLHEGLVFPVADELAQRGPPFVFLSGYTSEFIPTRYLNVPRFEKPFKNLPIIQELSRLLVSASRAAKTTEGAPLP